MKSPLYTSRGQRIVPVASIRPRAMGSHLAWRLTSSLVAFVATLCLFFTPVEEVAASDSQSTLPSILLQINGVPLTVELATTSQQRYMGLSYRQQMVDDAGMLFVYPAERPLTFTMRNTLIPLSIAYISKDMIINEIHLMDVGPGQLFDSKNIAMFALEVNQGWFEENGIKAGDRIVMP